MDGHLDTTNMAWLLLDLGDEPLDFLVDTGVQGTVVVGEDVFDTSKANWAGDTEAMLAAARRGNTTHTWFRPTGSVNGFSLRSWSVPGLSA